MLPAILLAAFPHLEADEPVVIREADPRFNCVAWAAGVVSALWWPADPDGYWPEGVPDELTLEAFVAALGTVGYVPCADGGPDSGLEKAAIYARAGVPTHVTRQSIDGRWTSKLGQDCLVSHASLRGLEGTVYGSVVMYLKRAAKDLGL